MRKIVFTISILLAGICSYAQPYTNLALKGGGIRGIAYVGALKVLEEKGITDNIKNVTGTSCGAIVGTLFSLGYTANEMRDIMLALGIQKFNDGQWFFIGGVHRMRKNYGWYKGKAMERWIGHLIKQKTGNELLTFGQLHQLALNSNHYKDLYITATNLNQQKLVVFSWKTYPDMYIKTAVRASISVPLYFKAVPLDSSGHEVSVKNSNANIYVDGGILANYPLNIFDTSGTANMATLGLKLERPEQIEYKKSGLAPFHIMSFRSYIGALYNITIETLTNSNTTACEEKRTIYISTGNLSPRVRKIKQSEKMLLYQNGREAAEQFFQHNKQTNNVQ